MTLFAPCTPLEPVSRDTPAPGPGEVSLRVRACAVCRTDLHIIDGELPLPRLPLVPGHEIVGTVEALGAGVTTLRVGERIGVPWLGRTCGHCAYCDGQAENLCDEPVFTGYTRDGGFATHAVADARYCFWLGGFLFVVGSVADILDGALARAASKGTVFGAFLDSTFDRLGEAAMLTAIGLVFMRDGNEIALVATFAAVIGSFLVSYTRAKAEALGLRADVGFGSRVERVALISVGLFLAPWGLLQWPIYILAALAWITVVQRMLFVRRQLRELAEA